MIRCLVPLLIITGLAGADLPADLFATTAPTDAVGVIAARTAVTPGAAITVHGIVGGRPKPFADGHALFTLMDGSLLCTTACGSGWSGCGMPPETLRAGLATVQVTDGAGRPLTTSLAGAGGLAPGSKVVVRGTVAAASNDKALIISATAIHVVPAVSLTPGNQPAQPSP
jgi:hypothetical protein